METTPLAVTAATTTAPARTSSSLHPNAGSGVDGASAPAKKNNSRSSRYYFLNNRERESYISDNYGPVYEGIPKGADADEFAPRQLDPGRRSPPGGGRSDEPQSRQGAAGGGGAAGRIRAALFEKLKKGGGGGSGKAGGTHAHGEVGTLLKLRKVPVKVEPKVIFANERTLLAWMHLSVILAGAGIAILAFAEDRNHFSRWYGVVMIPVAVAFVAYAMYQYNRRAYMLRHRLPGPYQDTRGPTVLGIMLMLSILSQFALRLYDMST